MKNVLILVICTLLSAGILCASTTPIANLTAPSISLVPGNNDQLKLQAGDGGPAPVCAPGRPCNNDQERLLIAL